MRDTKDRISLSRRGFVTGAAGAGLVGMGLAAALPTRLTFAATSEAKGVGNKRLALILLRGGFDGMTMLPPVGDKDYAKRRGSLALPPSEAVGGLTPIDSIFALHPAARALVPFWLKQELAFIPAAATPDRSRDHETAQRYLESGIKSDTPRTGWLNRAIGEIGGTISAESFIMPPPLVLRGLSQGTVNVTETETPISPAFYEQVRALYQGDGLFAPTLARGKHERALKAESLGANHAKTADAGANPFITLPVAAALAGQEFARKDQGNGLTRIAVIECSGWDIHADQGRLTGRLPSRIATLSEALATLAAESGDAWKNTIVIVASEFGRSVIPNAKGGTEHGTGGLALVMGGAAIGGIKGKWPGLGDKDLLDGKDIRPTVDIRSVLKRILQDHLKVPGKALDSTVFPGSSAIKPLAGLVRE